MYNGSNVWLIKPNDFNRGRGVRLFNSLDQLKKLLKELSQGNEMDFYVHNACCTIIQNQNQLISSRTLKNEQHPKDKKEDGLESNSS